MQMLRRDLLGCHLTEAWTFWHYNMNYDDIIMIFQCKIVNWWCTHTQCHTPPIHQQCISTQTSHITHPWSRDSPHPPRQAHQLWPLQQDRIARSIVIALFKRIKPKINSLMYVKTESSCQSQYIHWGGQWVLKKGFISLQVWVLNYGCYTQKSNQAMADIHIMFT
jgi:hypothetical protein